MNPPLRMFVRAAHHLRAPGPDQLVDERVKWDRDNFAGGHVGHIRIVHARGPGLVIHIDQPNMRAVERHHLGQMSQGGRQRAVEISARGQIDRRPLKHLCLHAPTLLGLEQPRVLDGDHGLVGEGRGQREMGLGEIARLVVGETDAAQDLIARDQGHAHPGIVAETTGPPDGIRRRVRHKLGLALVKQAPEVGKRVDRDADFFQRAILRRIGEPGMGPDRQHARLGHQQHGRPIVSQQGSELSQHGVQRLAQVLAVEDAGDFAHGFSDLALLALARVQARVVQRHRELAAHAIQHRDLHRVELARGEKHHAQQADHPVAGD